MDSALKAFLDDQGWSQARALAAICACWDEVVGVDVAAHVQPLALRGEVLVLAVDHATWSAQLTFLAPELLDRLGDRLGAECPRRVETTVRRP
ncbi:MAG: DUF721 domain-containing protein [Actinomycetota bacterium]|nr:DUF721 domain-containing protein [Actinomycetota bacterium]